MTRLSRLLFFSTFFIAGFTVALTSAWDIYVAYQARSWPSVQGKVMLDECTRCSDGACSHQIKYQYSVAKNTYINDREYFGFPIGVGTCAKSYASGNNIHVFYDAKNPAHSILKPKVYRPALLGLVGGLLFMAFAVYGFFATCIKPSTAANMNKR